MKAFRVADSPVAMDAGGVVGKKVYARKELALIHMELSPGSVVAPHATPFDAQFFVLEGSGEILIGDETVKVEADTLVESPKGIPHGIRNTGSARMRLLVLKTPNPDF